MKEIKILSRKIKDQQAEIERIETEIARASSIVAAAKGRDDALESLRQTRCAEVAQAIIDKRTTDTARIDSQIAEAVKSIGQSRDDSHEATMLAERLRSRADELREELRGFVRQQRGSAIGELERIRGDAIDEYVAAVNALGPIVARFKAADVLIRKVNPSEALPAEMPGERLYSRLKAERMPVPWSHSEMDEPKYQGIIGQGVDDRVLEGLLRFKKYVPVLAAPSWMSSDAAVEAAIAAESDKLRAAGVEI